MFLIAYCTLEIAVFLWLFGHTTAALLVVGATVAFYVYVLIRRYLNRHRSFKSSSSKSH